MELFKKDLPFLLKLNEREQKHQKINVAVQLKESTSPLQNKELVIRLTDDNDPFFLYSLTLNEDDYCGLKSQQGLLVDYCAFPQKFIDLLNLCLTESTREAPKFHLQLVTFAADKSTALLNVVEANPFKHLTHLSLKVLLAGDSVLKKYLAECLISLREERAVLTQTLNTVRTDLTSQLSRAQELLTQRTSELDQLKTEWTTHNTTLSSKHALEVEAERERATQTQTEAMRKFEAEKQTLIQSYEGKLLQLETKVQSLESHNRVLSETRYKLEATVSELKSKLQVADDELCASRQDLLKVRQNSHSLDSTVHELERSIQQLSTKVAVQEQELKDKEEVIVRTNQLLNAANEQKLKAEATVENHQKQIVKLDAAYKTASQEVLKGNEIIQKLQNERMRAQGKLKMKNVAVMQQEKLLEEKESSIAHHEREINSLTQSVTQKQEEVNKLTRELASANEELEKCKGVLRNNENVINWLQKQINEQTVNSMGPSGQMMGLTKPATRGVPLGATTSSVAFNRPQFTSTPTSAAGRQVFGSLNSQQNMPHVTFRGPHKVFAHSTELPDKPITGVSSSKSDPKLDEENRQSSLPGKYLAPEKIKPHSQAPPTGMKSGGVIPSIATHQYMSGTSPVICPTVPLKERTTPTTQK